MTASLQDFFSGDAQCEEAELGDIPFGLEVEVATVTMATVVTALQVEVDGDHGDDGSCGDCGFRCSTRLGKRSEEEGTRG